MLKLLPLAALFAPVAAPAEPAKTVFEYQGERYVYTAKVSAGRTFIRGYVEKGFAPFELTVRNGRVAGTVSGRPVSFRVAEATKIDATQVAVR